MTNTTTTNNATPSLFEGYTKNDVEAMRLLLGKVKLPYSVLATLLKLPEFSWANGAVGEIQKLLNTVPATIEGQHQIAIVCNFADLVRKLLCFCPAEAGTIIAEACQKIRSGCHRKAYEEWDKGRTSQDDCFDESSVEYSIDLPTCALLVERVLAQTKESLIADIYVDASIEERRKRW